MRMLRNKIERNETPARRFGGFILSSESCLKPLLFRVLVHVRGQRAIDYTCI